ncbi:MAG: T9SS type A sorting domain-containing protein, partial [Ignavibacteriae bacterium]|nr:T9SS type A sorting domain-containing protein [Ignavibacteriota bacterium]
YTYKDSKVNSGKYNYRIKQIDYNGNFEFFALSSTVEIGIPQKYVLSQNYPNPFNPTTKIDYQIPKDAKVKITVYDVTGKEVLVLVNDNQKAGFYTVQMDATNISSGNYFYRMTTSEPDGKENIISKKLTVVK